MRVLVWGAYKISEHYISRVRDTSNLRESGEEPSQRSSGEKRGERGQRFNFDAFVDRNNISTTISIT